MDVFNGDLTPGLLISHEAFELVKRSLADDGIFSINLIANIRENTAGMHSILMTLHSQFEHVNYYPVYQGPEQGITNIVVLAYNGVERSLDHSVLNEMAFYPRLK